MNINCKYRRKTMGAVFAVVFASSFASCGEVQSPEDGKAPEVSVTPDGVETVRTEEPELPWGEWIGGVRTRIVPVTKNISIGNRALIDLVMENSAEAEKSFYYEDGVLFKHNPFLVKDESGNEVRSIEAPSYSTGGPNSLRPGETAAVVENFDLFSNYLITKPGKYAVQFRGRETGYHGLSVPLSGVTSISIGSGEVPTEDQLLDAIAPVLPDEWRISRTVSAAVMIQGQTTSGGVTVSIFRKMEKNLDILTIKLWCLTSKVQLDSKGEFFGRWLDYLGKGQHGHYYLSSPPRAELVWSDHREALTSVLQLDEPGAP